MRGDVVMVKRISACKNPLRRLRSSLKRAIANDATRHASIVGLQPGPDTIMLVAGTDPMFFWAGLNWHPEDSNLLLCVPADEAPWRGTIDVYATHQAGFLSPLTLRCAFATWFDQKLLGKCSVVSRMDPRVRIKALDILERIVDGNAGFGSRDDDESLDVWYSAVGVAAHEVERLRDR